MIKYFHDELPIYINKEIRQLLDVDKILKCTMHLFLDIMQIKTRITTLIKTYSSILLYLLSFRLRKVFHENIIIPTKVLFIFPAQGAIPFFAKIISLENVKNV